MEIITKLAGVEVNQPNNLNSVRLSVSVTPEGDKVIQFDGSLTWGRGDLRYANDAYSLLNNISNTGLTGRIGVAEAVPIMIIARELDREITILDSLLDLWDAEYDEENREISAPLIQRGGADWIANNTKGVSFEYLRSLGKITENDLILVPYVLEKQNSPLEKITAILTGVVVVTQIQQQIVAIQEIATETASVSPWTAVLKISIRVAYILVLLKTLIDAIVRVINLFIQPVKYLAGMPVKRHFEILFGHLGFKFESTIFDGDEQYLTIIPEKYSNPRNKDYDDIIGWIKPDKSKQNGYYKGYGFDFCQIFKEFYNAKFIVDEANSIIRFERRDYKQKVSSFEMPPIWQKVRYNKEDFFANHLFEFQTDISDRHTIQEYSGTSSQVNISLASPENPQYSLLNNGRTVSVPFALLKVKTELSDVENILKGVLDAVNAVLNVLISAVNAAIVVINAILGAINAIIKALKFVGIKIKINLKPIPKLGKTDLGASIKNRVGMFKMEEDIVTTPKLAYIKPSANEKNNRQYKELRAEDIQERYHSIDFFTRGNQYKIGSEIGIAINFDQIYDIINADVLQDGSELMKLEWSLMDHTASIQVKKPFTYLNGALEESKLVADGS